MTPQMLTLPEALAADAASAAAAFSALWVPVPPPHPLNSRPAAIAVAAAMMNRGRRGESPCSLAEVSCLSGEESRIKSTSGSLGVCNGKFKETAAHDSAHVPLNMASLRRLLHDCLESIPKSRRNPASECLESIPTKCDRRHLGLSTLFPSLSWSFEPRVHEEGRSGRGDVRPALSSARGVRQRPGGPSRRLAA